MEQTIIPAKTKRPLPREARNAPLPKVGKRVGAALIDLALFIGLIFAFDFLALTPIMKSAVNLQTRRQVVSDDSRDSHLYKVSYYDENGSEIVASSSETSSSETTSGKIRFAAEVPANYKTYKLANIAKADYPLATYEYYTIYKLARINDVNNPDLERATANKAIALQFKADFVADPVAWYINTVLQIDKATSPFTSTEPATPPSSSSSPRIHRLFGGETSTETVNYTFLPAGVYVKAGTLNTTLQTFYDNIYKIAVRDFNAEPDHARTIAFNNFIVLTSAILSALIVYLMFPYIFKHGATLGKKILKIGIVDTYGYKVKWWQIFFRFLVLFVLELYLGLQTGFITTFISFTLLMFGKKARAAHDFLALTRPVDLTVAKIYRSPAEEDELDPVAPEVIDVEAEENKEEPTLSLAERAEKVDEQVNVVASEEVKTDVPNEVSADDTKDAADQE